MLKFFGFRYCSTFVCLWQIFSNHRLTRIKRFISRFTGKLCNQFSYMCYKIRCDGNLENFWFLEWTKQGRNWSGNCILGQRNTYYRSLSSLTEHSLPFGPCCIIVRFQLRPAFLPSTIRLGSPPLARTNSNTCNNLYTLRLALFSSQKLLVWSTVALSFLFDKYCLIME